MIWLVRGFEWDRENEEVGDLVLEVYDNEAAATLHAGNLWHGSAVALEPQSNYIQGEGGGGRLDS